LGSSGEVIYVVAGNVRVGYRFSTSKFVSPVVNLAHNWPDRIWAASTLGANGTSLVARGEALITYKVEEQ